MDNRNVLIVYASAGHGHEKAAKAVQEACLDAHGPGTAKTIDTLKLAPGPFGEFYKQIYLFQIKYLPWLWGAFYYSTDVSWVYFFVRSLRRLLNACTMKKLEEIILAEKPAVIIATHFTVIEVVNHLKKRGLIGSKLCVIVTDYYPHYVWTAPLVDRYIVAADETKRGLVQRGAPESIISVLGIPIEKKFGLTEEKEALCRKNGLQPDHFTVLVTSGGGGIGAMRDIVLQILKLSKTLQVLVVCGTNKSLYDALKIFETQYPGLKTFGFVNNMNELMRMSDLVVGKGGGLTITESFSMGKPVVLFGSVPGQEARNVLFIRKHEAGFAVNDLNELVGIVSRLIQAPDELNRLTNHVRAVAKPKAAADIAALIGRIQ